MEAAGRLEGGGFQADRGIGVEAGDFRAGGQALQPGGVGFDPNQVGDPEGAIFDPGGVQQLEEGSLGAGGGLLELLDDEAGFFRAGGQGEGGAEVGLLAEEDEEF